MKKYYDISIIILAFISIAFVVLDMSGNINLKSEPYKSIDFIILTVFWIDYISRIYKADDKKIFIKKNVFDLIAILPFNTLFSLFRVFRVFRILRLVKIAKAVKIVRCFGFMVLLNKRLHVFLHTNNFIYVLYTSLVLVLTSSFLMAYIENQSFGDALWWSIVTCTTVGYGDISPATTLGRIIAIVLMIFGIGLLGMLTGTITTYFTISKKEIKIDPQNIFESLSDTQMEKVIEYATFLKSKGD